MDLRSCRLLAAAEASSAWYSGSTNSAAYRWEYGVMRLKWSKASRIVAESLKQTWKAHVLGSEVIKQAQRLSKQTLGFCKPIPSQRNCGRFQNGWPAGARAASPRIRDTPRAALMERNQMHRRNALHFVEEPQDCKSARRIRERRRLQSDSTKPRAPVHFRRPPLPGLPTRPALLGSRGELPASKSAMISDTNSR